MKGSIGGAFWVVGCMLLIGCGQRQGLAPVEELKWIPFNQSARYHIVRSNDTLFSIAFRYEKDYHDLVKVNQLRPPYNIKPGQKILLVNKSGKKIIPVANKTIVADRGHHRPIVRLSGQWPVKGRLTRTFAPQAGRKGIDISVSKQSSVKASFDGVVAYSGNGIPGYGNLIIVKHDNHYLTAYAHNAKNLVNEGDSVRKGQAIAYTGLITAGSRGLHFELRKNGKPVNPLNYLTNG